MSELFGTYQPGTSLWHRLGAGPKYVCLLALLLPPLILQSGIVTVAALGVTAIVLLTTGLGPKTLAIPWGLVFLLALLAGFQVFLGRPDLAVVVAGNLLVAVWSSRLLLFTTPGSELVDALISACQPLRFVGVSPERVGLAVALMLRSVPVLLGAFTSVRQAARARGLERNLIANVTPVVLQAVAYAHATGEALAARGLGERDN